MSGLGRKWISSRMPLTRPHGTQEHIGDLAAAASAAVARQHDDKRDQTASRGEVGGIEMTAHVSRAELEDRLRGIQAITDATLSRLDDHQLLAELLDRTRDILRADTAAVLLL